MKYIAPIYVVFALTFSMFAYCETVAQLLKDYRMLRDSQEIAAELSRHFEDHEDMIKDVFRRNIILSVDADRERIEAQLQRKIEQIRALDDEQKSEFFLIAGGVLANAGYTIEKVDLWEGVNDGLFQRSFWVSALVGIIAGGLSGVLAMVMSDRLYTYHCDGAEVPKARYDYCSSNSFAGHVVSKEEHYNFGLAFGAIATPIFVGITAITTMVGGGARFVGNGIKRFGNYCASSCCGRRQTIVQEARTANQEFADRLSVLFGEFMQTHGIAVAP